MMNIFLFAARLSKDKISLVDVMFNMGTGRHDVKVHRLSRAELNLPQDISFTFEQIKVFGKWLHFELPGAKVKIKRQ